VRDSSTRSQPLSHPYATLLPETLFDGDIAEGLGIEESPSGFENKADSGYLEHDYEYSAVVGGRSDEAVLMVSQNRLTDFATIVAGSLLQNGLNLLRLVMRSFERTSTIQKDHVRVRWKCVS